MISEEELRKIARIKGLRLGYTEKDYLIDLCLLSISRRTGDELVFKGGTCLYKFYKLDRFSEDIDFTLRKKLDINNLIKKIISDLELFGIDAKILSKKKFFNSYSLIIRTKGPLYKGTNQTLSQIRMDINTKSSINLEPLIAEYISIYSEIPKISLLIMNEKEILAEKIRAILTRDKARDVYDLWFLLRKGVEFDLNLIKEKLKYYNEEWNKTKFLKKLLEKEKIWEIELKQLVRESPKFEEVLNVIKKALKEKN